ncbi:hypothetical protein [Burkholderia sp. NLJ2]|uniref:hypothetical protein n=1 Tax=Burkholderia sp. NLJ2 TaxID=3090699 RepID=UPI003C6C4609
MIARFVFGMFLVLSLMENSMAGDYAAPGLVVCDGSVKTINCPIRLDGDGFFVDSASDARLSSEPNLRRTLSDATLYGSMTSLILEYGNVSSSKNWTILIFSYINGVMRARNYISLSRATLFNGERWVGQSCRGNVVLNEGREILENAFEALCDGKINNKSPDSPDTVATRVANQAGLVVTVPAYDAGTKDWSEATYAFPSGSGPDARTLLCLSGCKIDVAYQYLGGWIGNNFWISASFPEDRDGRVDGSYMYLKNETLIAVKGSIRNGRMNLTEYLASGNQPVATFKGKTVDDSYVGTWTSKNRKYNFFLATKFY